MPRLNAADKVALQGKIGVNTDEAIGLTIYNTDTKKVEFWNGTEWMSIPSEIKPNFHAENGLTPRTDGYKTYVGLGGELIENTTINLQGKSLNITQQPAAGITPVFQVKNTNGNFTVSDKKVAIGVADATAKLHINKTALLTNGLRIADGSQGTNKVLTMQADGNAKWEELPENVSTKKSGITNISLGDNIERKIGNSLTCEPGKWLIIGKVNTANSSAGNLYTWAKIKDNAVPVNNVLAVAGVKTEVGGMRFSMPEVVYYAVFDVTTVVSLYAQAPGSSSTLLNFGGDVGFFFAIKLAN